MNFDRFIDLPPHEPSDHKWKIPVSHGPVFGRQVIDAQGLAQLLKSQEANVAAAMPGGFGELLKDADIPGFTERASSTRAAAPASSQGASMGLWAWLLPLVLVGGLAWWFFSEQGREVAQKSAPIQTGSIEKKMTPSSLVVDGTDLGQAWDKTVKGLTKTLGTITDQSSAQSALPQLDTASSELQKLSSQSEKLPQEARSVLATLVTKARPSIEKVFAKVLEIPGVAAVAEPVITKLRARLDELAQA